MKKFEEIEAVLFGKCNKEAERKAFCQTELKAYNELASIAKRFKTQEITKDHATADKLKLKEKYELCTRHVEVMADILDYIIEGEWNANDSLEYATFIGIGFLDIANKIDQYGLPMYNGLVVEVEKYLESKIKSDFKED